MIVRQHFHLTPNKEICGKKCPILPGLSLNCMFKHFLHIVWHLHIVKKTRMHTYKLKVSLIISTDKPVSRSSAPFWLEDDQDCTAPPASAQELGLPPRAGSFPESLASLKDNVALQIWGQQ